MQGPLDDLLRKNTPYRWTEAATQAFVQLKNAISQPLKLCRPDFKLQFILQTDASSKGIAAVLYQEPRPNQRNIISYASAKLNGAQSKYHVNEQECLAVVWAVKRYQPYLEDRKFTLKTDSRALLWLDRTKDDKSKLTRWALRLQEFSFDVIHCPGKENELPDYLSRNPTDRVVEENTEEDISRLLPPPPAPADRDDTGPPFLANIEVAELADRVKQSQRNNPHAGNLITTWNLIQDNGPADPAQNRFFQNYTSHDGYLYRKSNHGDLLVVPVDMKEAVLHAYHDSPTAGHPGAEETERAIYSHYHWPKMGEDVRNYVRNCWVCTVAKRGPIQEATVRPRQPSRPWEVISVDLMGPYTTSHLGNRFILLVTDLYNMWVEAFPLRLTTTDAVVNRLENEVFGRYGFQREIVSDNGPQFISVTWDAALRHWGCYHWTTPIFHPQANPVERRNQEIKKGLRIHLDGEAPQMWDRKLPVILFTLRTRKNAATGTTPSNALLGYELPRPGEWHATQAPATPIGQGEEREERIRTVHRNQHRYRSRYANFGPTRVQFQAGDEVMERSRDLATGEFQRKWKGPYRVIANAGTNSYFIQRDREQVKVHIHDLRPAPNRREAAREPPPPDRGTPHPPPRPAISPTPPRHKRTSRHYNIPQRIQPAQEANRAQPATSNHQPPNPSKRGGTVTLTQ
uniref:RNA-directed DNA polymerase n=1 Tax=Photinus pyralis TaxID=7054 RepID=A0A1Y1LYJ6_PHOPY